MKKIIIIAACIITLFSCNQDGGGAFAVSGSIQNPPAKMVYLEELSYDQANPVVLDSAQIDANGGYSLNSTSLEQNLYLLSFDHNPAVIFVNDGKDINISFDVKNFRTPKVTGSVATQQLYDFLHSYSTLDSLLAETYHKIDTLHTLHPADTATMALFRVEGVRHMNAMNDLITAYVGKSASAAADCFVLDKARNTMMPDAIAALLKQASEKFPNHKGLAIFKTTLAPADPNAGSSTYGLMGQQAPDLTMNDVNGKPLSISSFKGKYLLVDFWASWCGPCRQENPTVVAAYNKFKDKNFEVLGVSLDENKTSWLAAIKKDNLAWPQMSDLKYWDSEAVGAYGLEGIPFNVLLDPQGKIIAYRLRGDALEQKLAEVLK